MGASEYCDVFTFKIECYIDYLSVPSIRQLPRALIRLDTYVATKVEFSDDD